MKDDPQLRDLLRSSLPDVPLPSRFGAEVWQRIETRIEASPQFSLTRFFALFTRPAFAAVTLFIAVASGAGVATLKASQANEQARATLVERHVATLDPYAHLVVAR